ncbi:MAG: hypothetical protein ICV81_17280, partial [Flavisolibacter sp.]|nr:hypothetical protein [Flavisolibacter sp.]
NGFSGAIIYSDKNNPVPDLLIAIDVDEKDKIQNLYFIRNPDKLQYISN